MARGRNPEQEVVVPMTEDGVQLHNLDERAKMRLEELRPEGMPDQLRWMFDRMALPLCHPTVDRLTPVNGFMFMQLCRAIVRHERLILELDELTEIYESHGRQGVQIKSRPEVAQLNETFRQIRGLAGEFGMTPSTERSVTGGKQLGFKFADLPGEEYLT